ncbi:MAG: hypothetical protein WD076_06950 [Parvularculaceae bacterium]
MAGEPLRASGVQGRLQFAARRFHAWWEGYAFDPGLESADIAERLGEGKPHEGLEYAIAELIWGAGRHEPGDPAWTMRHARTLGLPTKAHVVVFGAGGGAPLRDLKAATRWKVAGLSRVATRLKGFDHRTYDAALTRPLKTGADGAISFFELHRDADPAAFARFASELLRPSAAISFVDYTLARKGARLKGCFPEAAPGAPRVAADTIRMLKEAGFAVSDTVDETRLFTPLIVKGWAQWKRAYEAANAAGPARQRGEMLRFLSGYAHLWAERLDALKAGHLQVSRFQARKAV